MPHLTLQYSVNMREFVAPAEILVELNTTLSRVLGLDISNFKSRAVCLDDFCVGDGSAGAGFVHLDVRLLGGRSVEMKQKVADAAIDVLRPHVGRTKGLGWHLTVDLNDLEPTTYRKVAG